MNTCGIGGRIVDMEHERPKRPPLEERLLKGLKEANEWARGERDDLRVTVVSLPDDAPQLTDKPTASKPTK